MVNALPSAEASSVAVPGEPSGRTTLQSNTQVCGTLSPMSTHSLAGVDLHLALDPSLRERLEKLAAAIGRDASELASAALRGFLDENERQMEAIDAGIAEADAGQLLDYEDVKAGVLEKLSALAKR